MNSTERNELIAAYRADPSSTELRNKIVEANLPWIKCLARTFIKQGSVHFDGDDLVNAGVLALIDVLSNLSRYGQLSVTTVSRWPILTAMRPVASGLRLSPTIKRWHAHRALELAMTEQRYSPNDFDLATTFGVDEAFVSRLQKFMAATRPEFNESTLLLTPSPDTNEAASRALDAVVFREVVMRVLCKQHQLIIDQVYFHDKSFTEVGEMLGLTRSRVGQIHDVIISRLKKHLARWDESHRDETQSKLSR